MGAPIPKVLFTLGGKPLIRWVIEAAQAAGIPRVVVVIGHQGDSVRDTVADLNVEFVWQYERKGTGHAVMQAEPLLSTHQGPVVVLNGDVPRIQPDTLRSLIATQVQSGAAAAVVTVLMDDPTGYGRIVRRPGGLVDRIVEERDADPDTKAIKEINTGTFCFRAAELFATLHQVTNNNAQGEYYLTDVVSLLCHKGLSVVAVQSADPDEAHGVNSQEQLAALERLGRTGNLP
ncbi:MAG: NTP transferase domain-containing protein [candidate division Zixibacteria bacterium]|nr:NTP transferase domain-containing protein [candidate division Zixibacteria bacterium]